MSRLQDMVVMVTGGGSGIGRATARAMAREGATLIPADIDLAAAEETCRLVAEAGGKATAIQLDVTDEVSWATAIERVKDEFGGLNTLVNNAGIALLKPMSETTLADWKRQVAINLDGVFLGTRTALPLLAGSENASIVNVASSAGRQGVPLMTGYSATKAAVINFTKAAALECSQLNIPVRINVVSPGSVATPIWVKLNYNGVMPADGVDPTLMQAMREVTNKITPIGFAGEAEDIALAIVYMASKEARFMFGGELVIDGGNSAGTATMPVD